MLECLWNTNSVYQLFLRFFVGFFDRLDFSGQPNLTQWIKTVSQQVKALHLLRNEDCASKSEEICIFVYGNGILFMEKTKHFGSATMESRDDGITSKNSLGLQSLVMEFQILLLPLSVMSKLHIGE